MSIEPYVSPWWQAVLLPEKWSVCGIVVPSLSLWHTFALDQIGNAYINGGNRDLDAASSLLVVAERNIDDGIKLMTRQRYMFRCLKRKYKQLRNLKWENLDSACQDYVSSCTRTLSRWVKSNDSGKVCVCPQQWHIVYVLCSKFGINLKDAWNMPYAYARCLYDVAAEREGDDSLMSVAAQKMEDEWVKNGN